MDKRSDSIALKPYGGDSSHPLNSSDDLIFDAKAEAALRRKIDLRLVPPVMFIYLFCFIDRTNIGNARLAGLEKDLNMTGTYDFNILLSLFYIGYLLSELPCNYLCKLFGPSRFIPLLTVIFGILSVSTAFIDTFGQGLGVRFLLGCAEAGVFPGIGWYLTRWYRKDEYAVRVGGFIVAAPLAGAFGGLFASALLEAKPFGKVHSWRMIFFAEGFITIGVGIISYLILSDGPESASWLTKEEKVLAVARVKSENVGTLVLCDEVSKEMYWQGMMNPTAIVSAFVFVLSNITAQGIGFFLPTIMKSIYPHKSTIVLQLRTVPPYFVGAFFTLFVPYISYRTHLRAFYMIVIAAFVFLGYALFLISLNPLVRYAAVFLITPTFSSGVLTLAWTGINTTSDTARAGAIALACLGANVGGLVATWAFLTQYSPRQVPGNTLNLCTALGIIGLSAGLWAWQKEENRQREEEGAGSEMVDGMDREQVARLGQKHPGFRYRH